MKLRKQTLCVIVTIWTFFLITPPYIGLSQAEVRKKWKDPLDMGLGSEPGPFEQKSENKTHWSWSLLLLLPMLTGFAWRLQEILNFMNRRSWRIRMGAYGLVLVLFLCFFRNYFAVVRKEVSFLVKKGQLGQECEQLMLPEFPQIVLQLFVSYVGGGKGKNIECRLDKVFLSIERLYEAVEFTMDQFVNGAYRILSMMMTGASMLRNFGGLLWNFLLRVFKFATAIFQSLVALSMILV